MTKAVKRPSRMEQAAAKAKALESQAEAAMRHAEAIAAEARLAQSAVDMKLREKQEKRDAVIKFKNSLGSAKLPDRTPTRHFATEVNAIARYWDQHGVESGLSFSALLCLCQSLPGTDWGVMLSNKNARITPEESRSLNERFPLEWKVWQWFYKTVDDDLKPACIIGLAYEFYQHDLPTLIRRLEKLHGQQARLSLEHGTCPEFDPLGWESDSDSSDNEPTSRPDEEVGNSCPRKRQRVDSLHSLGCPEPHDPEAACPGQATATPPDSSAAVSPQVSTTYTQAQSTSPAPADSGLPRCGSDPDRIFASGLRTTAFDGHMNPRRDVPVPLLEGHIQNYLAPTVAGRQPAVVDSTTSHPPAFNAHGSTMPHHKVHGDEQTTGPAYPDLSPTAHPASVPVHEASQKSTVPTNSVDLRPTPDTASPIPAADDGSGDAGSEAPQTPSPPCIQAGRAWTIVRAARPSRSEEGNDGSILNFHPAQPAPPPVPQAPTPGPETLTTARAPASQLPVSEQTSHLPRGKFFVVPLRVILEVGLPLTHEVNMAIPEDGNWPPFLTVDLPLEFSRAFTNGATKRLDQI